MIYLLALAVVLVAVLVAFAGQALLHLHGAALLLLVLLIVLAGVAAAVAILIIHFRGKRASDPVQEAASDAEKELDVLLADANRKLRSSKQSGTKSLDGLPLLYLLGDTGSAKTTIVLRSGLEPELIAGAATQDGQVKPTTLLNLWFTRQGAILEAGEALRQSPALLDRMIARTRPRAYRSVAPARAVAVCLNAEQLFAADAATALPAAARVAGAHLRQICRQIGAALPVYVLVNKLDRVAHFAEYVRNLSNDEVIKALGAPFARSDASAGVYADQMSRQISSTFDSITFRLGEFRIEILDRETDPKNLAGAYEFPREFGKLRNHLTQYLVELCKPSQLSANPYLRGVYFTGVRAQMVEQVAPVSAPVEQQPPQDVGATIMFNPQLQAAKNPPAQPARSSTRVPQWVFLSRLFPQVVLGDRSALSATQQTAPARLFRRALFASLAFIFLIFTVLLLVSYLHNSALEDEVRSAAQALPVAAPSGPPGLVPLQNLDRLRRVLQELEGYQQTGPPWSYRFGLYQGDKLAVRARQIYFDRFRVMLLNSTQERLSGYLRALPPVPAQGADYTQAYNPLKAYLITTSHPEKSVPSFLTPVLLQYSVASQPVDTQQSDLARKQFDFYGAELLRQNPYNISPLDDAVSRARAYLSHFGAAPGMYQDMRAAADKKFPQVDFNRLYANSAAAIVEPHVVSGAFTRGGFAFMQEAISHPERYFQGETWVLGDQAAGSLDAASVSRQVAALYSGDFIKEWHSFLTQARVVGCASLREAPDRLNTLASPDSPILEFFFTVSSNTAVPNQQIKDTFQPAQVLVDPNATTRYIGAGNTKYMDALAALSNAVNQYNQNPDTARDLMSTAAAGADLSVQQTAQAFNVDQTMHTDKAVIAILSAPLRCAAPPPPPGLPSTICSTIAKFPFAALPRSKVNQDLKPSEQASMQEVDSVFAPGTGQLWAYYNNNLKQWLTLQGGQYVLAPSAAGHVGPSFAQFFNKLAAISSALYPTGTPGAALNFTLRFVPSSGVQNAALVVDGQRIAAGSSVGPKWSGTNAHQASLEYNTLGGLQFEGTWALFQLVSNAKVTRTSSAINLEFPIEVSGRQSTAQDGTPQIVHFEVTGPGAQALVPGVLSASPCVTNVTK